MDFIEALARQYHAAPCQVLPNPLWKTLAALPGCQPSFSLDSASEPAHLEIWRDSQLLLYWDMDRGRWSLSQEQVDQITFALVHQDYLAALQPQRFSRRTAYFRLELRTGSSGAAQPARPAPPPGYNFRPVQVDGKTFLAEAAAVAALIGRCYADISPSVETVSAWTRHPAYAPELWVWAWDEVHARPAGLGIAEIDPAAGEGALEWIQVLPEYQGRGLGSALVRELLRRMGSSAPLITVSGEVENASAPEKLYRRCGFSGQDVWWVLEK